MNKDQVKGHVEEAKGRAQEVLGKAAGNKEMENNGKTKKIGGMIQKEKGNIKDDIKKIGGSGKK